MKLMSNCSPVGACALELYSVRNVAATNTGRQDALSAGDFVTLGGERRQLPGPLGQVGDPSPHPGGARLIDTRRRGRRQAATSRGGGSPGRFCFGKAGDSRAGPDLVLTIPARQGPAGLLCAAGLGPFGPNTMNGSWRGGGAVTGPADTTGRCIRLAFVLPEQAAMARPTGIERADAMGVRNSRALRSRVCAPSPLLAPELSSEASAEDPSSFERRSVVVARA